MDLSREPLRKPLNETTVSVILPVYNESKILPELITRVKTAILSCGSNYEVVAVNDGSDDGSDHILDHLALQDPHICVLHFSRNFGHQAALQAGLLRCSGDCIIVMDSDLQDKPEAIPQLLDKWQNGYDVVYVVRTARKENPIKQLFFAAFYRLLNLISDIPMPNDAGNFGLIDCRIAKHLCSLPEHNRYFAGLRSWLGFRQIGVVVERDERYDKRPRVSFWGLLHLAKTAFVSFSSLPLTLFYAISTLAFFCFFALAIFTLYHKLITHLAIPGWTSVIMVCCLFGALNSLGIAILGEYVLRIYEEVRARPTYVIERTVNKE